MPVSNAAAINAVLEAHRDARRDALQDAINVACQETNDARGKAAVDMGLTITKRIQALLDEMEAD